ncbi:DNA-3-methyladenine glycosylase [Microbacteriaceae bacterium VKM Ac-2854]|nr:DNA-3-methyladenine glycosylase [Microbacteriaceae bacterium VKM Ac-2854]
MSVDLRRTSVEVAPLLLGGVFRHRTEEGWVGVRLTEVEAYLGIGEDPGSHAHRGRTARTAPMFGEPGTIYAYFTYGMHTCVNVTCSPAGSASAVLLRGGEIVEGIELARSRRGTSSDRDLARGPARLAQALGVRLAESGESLGADFELHPLDRAPACLEGPRTGVAGAGGGAEYPWRFWLPGEPTVSVYRPAVPRRRAQPR